MSKIRTKSIFDFSENFITYGTMVEMNTREKSFEKFDVFRPLLQVLMSYVRDEPDSWIFLNFVNDPDEALKSR